MNFGIPPDRNMANMLFFLLMGLSVIALSGTSNDKRGEHARPAPLPPSEPSRWMGAENSMRAPPVLHLIAAIVGSHYTGHEGLPDTE